MMLLWTLLITFYGLQTVIDADAASWNENANSRQHSVKRRGFATPEHISALEWKLNSIEKSLDTFNKAMLSFHEKLTTLVEKRTSAPNWHDKLQSVDRKLDLLQRTQEEQESIANKLTGLEFTLNHVLSKVVYLSDNIQTRPADHIENAQQQHRSTTRSHPSALDIEILARLNDLLRHVQGIKRENCRRSSLPAAAGPLMAPPMNFEKSNKSMPYSSGNGTTITTSWSADDIVKQIVKRLNADVLLHDLHDMPSIMKEHSQKLNDVFSVVKKTDKRLENWSSEDLQHQSWQRMLQYCQDVSNEFSSFSGNSEAILKRIESFLRDLVYNRKKKNSSAACAGRRNSIPDIGNGNNTVNATSTAGFDSNYVDALPHKSGCHELNDSEYIEGIYRFTTPDVNSAGRDFNTRYCSFATTDDERAWTVIQRRGPYDVQENFNRSWTEYRNGFGELNKDFWFGNEFIHRLTSNNNYELLIELEDFDGGKMSIAYDSFGLDREHNNYSLYIGSYKGPGPDSLSYHNFMDFSTYDRNNNKDLETCCACAVGYGSGWWFDNCLEANLNGIYRFEPLNHSYVGIIWEHWLGDYSLKYSRMLVRPKNWTLIDIGDQSEIQWHEEP